MEWALTAIFAVDMFLSFRVALKDDAALVDDRSLIAAEYYRCLHIARLVHVNTNFLLISVRKHLKRFEKH